MKNKNKLEEKINNEIKKISRKGGKIIEVQFFTHKNMKAKDPLIKDIIKNGKRII